MASHDYGPMLINGGVVHNGDKVSVVQNNIEKALFLTEQDHIDVGELVTKLSSAVQHYDTLRYYLKTFGTCHKDLVIIEDPQLEDLSSSDDCLHPILEISQSLDEYQSFIKEFRTNVELSLSSEAPDDSGTIQLSPSHDEIRWKLNYLRDKLDSTIAVANISIQQRLQLQSMQQMDELKALRALVETESERQRLHSLPKTLPLKRCDLERARLNDDPEFNLRRYLEAPALQRPDVSRPSTPSMQGSSIAPSSTTGIISFVTALERQSLTETNRDTDVSTFQIFIKGFPQLKSLLLQVGRGDTIRTVKSKIEEKIDLTNFSLYHRDKLLKEDSIVSDNLIRSFDTINAVYHMQPGRGHIVVKFLTKTLTFFENDTAATYKDLTIQHLKTEIYKREKIPVAHQRVIWKGKGLVDSVFLHTITGPMALCVQLPSVIEDAATETSQASQHATISSRSSMRRTGSIRLFAAQRMSTITEDADWETSSQASQCGTVSSRSSIRKTRSIRLFAVQRMCPVREDADTETSQVSQCGTTASRSSMRRTGSIRLRTAQRMYGYR